MRKYVSFFIFIILSLYFFIFSNEVFAGYDFYLTAGPGHKPSILCAKVWPLKIENGSLSFMTQCQIPGTDQTLTISLEGEYLPKEKIIEGKYFADIRYKAYEGKKVFYETTACEFTSTPIEKDTNIIFYANKNCTLDYNTNAYSSQEDANNHALRVMLYNYALVTENDKKNETESVERPEDKDTGVRFEAIGGTVEIAPAVGYDEKGNPIYDDSMSTYAQLKMRINEDDLIIVDEGSSVTLSFPNMSIVTIEVPEDGLGPRRIIIPKQRQKDNQFELLWGKLKANVKRMMKDGTLEIGMSQAVAGIKGTTFVLEEDGKTSTIKVLDGQVEFTSKATNQKEIIKAGETISATDKGLATKQFFNVKEEIKKWPEKNKFKLTYLIVIVGISIIFVFLIKRYY